MDWKIHKDTAGGGALHRDGIHEVYALRHAAGAEPIRVTAEVGTYVWPIELETTAHVVYRFANGCLATLIMSWSAQGPGERGRAVYGTRGAVTFAGNRLQIHSQQPDLDEAALRGILGTPAPLALSAADGTWSIEAPKVAGGITAAVDAFARAVAEDAEPPVTGVDGLRALEMVVGAYRSAEEGRAVALPIVPL
jgi:predicted dehydrogenase